MPRRPAPPALEGWECQAGGVAPHGRRILLGPVRIHRTFGRSVMRLPFLSVYAADLLERPRQRIMLLAPYYVAVGNKPFRIRLGSTMLRVAVIGMGKMGWWLAQIPGRSALPSGRVCDVDANGRPRPRSASRRTATGPLASDPTGTPYERRCTRGWRMGRTISSRR